MKKSFKIVTENDSCAVNCFICECERSPIVKVWIPQWFRCDSKSLSFQFSVNDLDCNFVSGNSQLFDFWTDCSGELLSDFLGISQIVCCSFKFFGEYIFDDFSGFGRVEHFLRGRLKLISISSFSHFKVKSNVYKPKMLYFLLFKLNPLLWISNWKISLKVLYVGKCKIKILVLLFRNLLLI